MALRQKLFSVILLLSVLVGVIAGGSVALAAPQERQAQFVAPILVVNSSFLNVRTGPGVQYTVLVTIVGGTELPVLARGSDNVWFLVSTPVGSGWVNVTFTLPRGDFTNVPIMNVNAISAPIIVFTTPVTIGLPNLGQGGGGAAPAGAANTYTPPATVERFRALINVAAVNIRVQPDVTSASIGTVFRDETKDYAITGRSVVNFLEWLQIDVPGVGDGWVEAPKLLLRLSGRYKTVLVVNVQTVAMTSSPGGDNVGLPFLSKGQEVFLLNISADSNFVQVEAPEGQVGWLPFSTVVTRTGTPTDGLAGQAQAQSQAAAASPDQGQGGGGVAIPVLQLPHIVVNTSFLNVRSGPGGQYTSIATERGGTELVVVAITNDAEWYEVTGDFGVGWVDATYVVFRGDISNVPVMRYEDIIGTLSTPTAVIYGVVTLYAAPGTNFGAIGTLSGVSQYPVVARTSDGTWVQLNTPFGFGWVLASQVTLSGDTSLIPVVG